MAIIIIVLFTTSIVPLGWCLYNQEVEKTNYIPLGCCLWWRGVPVETEGWPPVPGGPHSDSPAP